MNQEQFERASQMAKSDGGGRTADQMEIWTRSITVAEAHYGPLKAAEIASGRIAGTAIGAGSMQAIKKSDSSSKT
jgi:hypothetical protein